MKRKTAWVVVLSGLLLLSGCWPYWHDAIIITGIITMKTVGGTMTIVATDTWLH